MSSPTSPKPASNLSGVSETWIPRGQYITHLLESGIGEKVRYQPGQYLYSQGEVDRRFYVLLSGKVHVSNLSADGQESTFNIMGPGSVLGEAAALTGLPRYSAALVIEPSELIQLQAGRLEEYVRADPRFAAALIYVLSVKQRLAVARLHQAVFEPPEQRILRLLEQMAESHVGQPGHEDEGELRVHLTHEQIGNLTNLSRVTVTRTLQKLKRDGRVRLVGRAMVLPSKAQPHRQ
jgi:CRP-like cAMP-binding protein